MPETSTGEAQRVGKSPACLSRPRAGLCEDDSEQELCSEHCLLSGQCQPLCRTLLAVASATSYMQLYTSLHVNACVCITILAKVVNNRITNFIKLESPRHSVGAFPKPGNQSAGLSMPSSALTSARKAHFWQEAPGSQEASEIQCGCRGSSNNALAQ